jgi:hypothetical protein
LWFDEKSFAQFENRPLYDRMINPYRETQERKQEQQERADAQKAADAKHKDTMEAVRSSTRRDKEKI